MNRMFNRFWNKTRNGSSASRILTRTAITICCLMIAYGVAGFLGMDGLFVLPVTTYAGIVERNSVLVRQLNFVNLSLTKSQVVISDQCRCAEDFPDLVVIEPFTTKKLSVRYRVDAGDTGRQRRTSRFYVHHENQTRALNIETDFIVR